MAASMETTAPRTASLVREVVGVFDNQEQLQIAVDLQTQIEQEKQAVAGQVVDVGQRIVQQKAFLRKGLLMACPPEPRTPR